MLDCKTFETTLAGRPLVVETGKMAQLAGGACLVRYGETVIHCTATMSVRPRDGIDFFPLSVDYEEKLYAVGHIPGSFMRREGRPSEKAILTSRVIDRPVRPLFPKDMRNDVSVVCTVMSVDPACPPEPIAMVGASIAISISEIPWDGPIAGVVVGRVDGQLVLNPSAEQEKVSDMHVTVSSTAELVAMIEAGASEVTNDDMFDAIMFGHAANQELVAFIQGIVDAVGKKKIAFESKEVPAALYEAVKELVIEDVRAALDTDDKRVRDERLMPVYAKVHAALDAQFEGQEAVLEEALYKLQKYVVRRWLLDEGKRVDGRGIDDMRPLDAEVALLPRTHGSGMFTRGQTQVLTTVTLGSAGDAQLLDGIDDDTEKRYMHHYNFPSYSVGETRPSRGPGRREIGHGALAERALLPVLPSMEEFPYVMRLVSEVLSSNGSTSQASICGSTLALMDAGVPLKAPVAGISCGLVTEGDLAAGGRFMTMVDIQGLEDFFGDMDFKVGGTKAGITAIQMDLKVHGLTPAIIREALEKTEKARHYILDEVMLKCIPAPRDEISQYAPKMLQLTIDSEKIAKVIGKGGEVIKKIQADYDCRVDIKEEGAFGYVFISALDTANAHKALELIKSIAIDPEIGAIYKGKVTRLMSFGAFVEIAPGKEGLVHISHLDIRRVDTVESIVNVGDEVLVKVLEIDDQGRLNLSRRNALIEVEGLVPENTISDAPRPPRRDGDRGRDRDRGGHGGRGGYDRR